MEDNKTCEEPLSKKPKPSEEEAVKEDDSQPQPKSDEPKTPVFLSSALQAEIFYNAITPKYYDTYGEETHVGQRLINSVNLTKFALSGKEQFLTTIEQFKKTKGLLVAGKIGFTFDEIASDAAFCFLACETYDGFLDMLIRVAVPHITDIWFGSKLFKFPVERGKIEWYDTIFDVLSKDFQHKELRIGYLDKVTDKVKAGLLSLVEKGVAITLCDPDKKIMHSLPQCEFDTLHLRDEMFHMEDLECSFKKFVIEQDLVYIYRLPEQFETFNAKEFYVELKIIQYELYHYVERQANENMKLWFKKIKGALTTAGKNKIAICFRDSKEGFLMEPKPTYDAIDKWNELQWSAFLKWVENTLKKPRPSLIIYKEKYGFRR